MLTVSPGQFAALTREHMLDRLRRFLAEQSADPDLLALLAAPHLCRKLWLPWYDRFAGMDEHAVAVRLSYLLAAQAHGSDPALAEVAGDDATIAMKVDLEERGIVPFIAFDQG